MNAPITITNEHLMGYQSILLDENVSCFLAEIRDCHPIECIALQIPSNMQLPIAYTKEANGFDLESKSLTCKTRLQTSRHKNFLPFLRQTSIKLFCFPSGL